MRAKIFGHFKAALIGGFFCNGVRRRFFSSHFLARMLLKSWRGVLFDANAR